MGTTIGSDGSVSGAVSAADIMDYIRRTTGGGALEYSRPVLGNCLIEREAERLFESALTRCNGEPGGGGNGGSPEEPGAPELTTATLLRDQIGRQMKHTTPPEEELKYGVERNGDIVATIVKPGPADVTSYHDFQELQIAFKHIWSEVFDTGIEELGKAWYEEIVKLEDWETTNEEGLPVHRYQNVTDLESSFRNIANARLRDYDREEIPSNVLAAFPTIRDVWSVLTPEERLFVKEQAHIYGLIRGDAGPANALRESVNEFINSVRREIARHTRLESILRELDERFPKNIHLTFLQGSITP
ncbi:MAG: hypothetical protein IPJ82_13165 [Lewinellaceae bacterium]|nr:hypothetical protein [Lewinellaceae bacterium]